MSVGKVIEITASSTKGFEDAIDAGIRRAAKTVSDIQGAWIQDQEIVVKGGKVVEYRVRMKVTFLLK
ncbi:MAG: dodecin protein [Deltaproteobacteria bacterium]|nr:dodecin protein [Deltaproteobacteria bacterium]